MNFLTDTLGLSIEYSEWRKKNSLPYALLDSFDFQIAEIQSVDCLFAYPKLELPILPELKKQIRRVQQAENLPVVLILNKISNFRIKAFIEERIPFIVTDKQIYLPFMATYLQMGREKQVRPFDEFLPSTQLLVLWYLYQDAEAVYPSYAQEVLSFSAMTISRAVAQLEQTDLFDIYKDGVKRVIAGLWDHQTLFGNAQAYLFNPVKVTGFIAAEKVNENMVLAGVSALAEKTGYETGALPVYAIKEGGIDLRSVKAEPNNTRRQVHIQVWKYDPMIFAKDGVADTLSLILSLKDETDRRIRQSVDELLRKQWLKHNEEELRAQKKRNTVDLVIL